eukprot:CAMPEP_0174743692 /NCGR_PEP_ID=MMETSP1094-20130205/82273_1 /TAXON_ID=156173 /ORGANISM="Chrysochromulina brevifilum, Strain UTEX LB 985" /LENGTH=36 /DNA_ID= /DNA_START= /DNA_END= /DNA_ORIENTATION=
MPLRLHASLVYLAPLSRRASQLSAWSDAQSIEQSLP